MRFKQYYVYIITNQSNTVLYIGVTGNILSQRVWEHKAKLAKGFTNKYNIAKLVYYEVYEDPMTAIAREKQLKAGSRKKKIDLVMMMNPDWNDLYESIV